LPTPASLQTHTTWRAPSAARWNHEASSSYDGRVEHLTSGQVARFHLLEELLGFMVSVLADVQAQSDSP
jgi:hypothetical protein